MDLIQTALAKGQKALSEYQSKQLLKVYELPVTREELAQNAEEAAAIAGRLGYPVVLKACSPVLMHKTEAGAVEIGLKTEEEVRSACQRLVQSATVPLEGILVQEMVRGNRELVLGLSRDPQFGPCVMLGLGGVLTEIINDTVFRVAPLEAVDAREMMLELRAKAILDPFRGQAAADRETISRSLMAIGRIGLENPAIAEIDINPMIIDPDGRVKAVDALVVLQTV
ncbi:MAG: acetate--CoA ligase family protein [Deltaproteobacteria bacterium]|nr:acetate--CoA ligase family protein [Deltaproteobacteria bacterium]